MLAILIVFAVLWSAKKGAGAAGEGAASMWRTTHQGHFANLRRRHPKAPEAMLRRMAHGRTLASAVHFLPYTYRSARRGWSEARAEYRDAKRNHQDWATEYRRRIREERASDKSRRQAERERRTSASSPPQAGPAVTSAPPPGPASPPTVPTPRPATPPTPQPTPRWAPQPPNRPSSQPGGSTPPSSPPHRDKPASMTYGYGPANNPSTGQRVGNKDAAHKHAEISSNDGADYCVYELAPGEKPRVIGRYSRGVLVTSDDRSGSSAGNSAGNQGSSQPIGEAASYQSADAQFASFEKRAAETVAIFEQLQVTVREELDSSTAADVARLVELAGIFLDVVREARVKHQDRHRGIAEAVQAAKNTAATSGYYAGQR